MTTPDRYFFDLSQRAKVDKRERIAHLSVAFASIEIVPKTELPQFIRAPALHRFRGLK